MQVPPHLALVLAKIISLSLLSVGLLAAQAAEPERAVVQIFNFAQQPSWETPWRFDPVRRMGGSGFVVKGKRIMSNAHVVSWGRQIIVRRYQDPRPYVAEVEFIGHECDLAVLTVADERFFDGIQPLELGELPKVRSAVVTCGYPAGGEEISFTRGVVSRIEMSAYAHIGNRQFLSVQTDAAINPGNSGGPVLQDDRVVGVAFQGMSGLENTGFFIPPPVIDHFLKDIQDGRYDGFPMAGLRMMPLQNPAYRAMLKLPDDSVGARIDTLLPIAKTRELLKLDDVILSTGGYPVASDGTILYQSNRVSAALAFQFPQAGESVPLRIWREGKPMEVSLPVGAYNEDKAGGSQYDNLPRYFVYAGLVFTPLSADYLRTLPRGNSSEIAADDLLYELYYRRNELPDTARPEPIVLSTVLADAINANFGVRGRMLVDRINGVRINRLEDVIQALEKNTNTFDRIEFTPNHGFECLDRADVASANTRILQTYGITKDRRL
jgi:S1-C subfamily serine protease